MLYNLYFRQVEEQGYIELRVISKDKPLSPKDVESFLYPNRKEKRNRPHISYDIEEGSVRHRFYLPITAVILFNGLTTEIKTEVILIF